MEEKGKNQFLTKTLFLKGLKCKRLLYLSKYFPNLRDEINERTEEIFQTGIEVNLLARKLFPEGREVPSEWDIDRQVAFTSYLIKEGINNIYEASFLFNDVFVRVDILHRGEEGWEIYEVKSSTGQKDEYIDDITLQFYVLENSGLEVKKAYLIHIDSDYTRRGELEIEKFLKKTDLTKAVMEKQIEIEGKISALKEILMGEIPEVEIGSYCLDNYQCEFKSFCWKDIPEDSIVAINLNWLKNRFELYKNGAISLEDLNPDEFEGNPKMYIEAFLEKKVIVNRAGIEDFLQTLWYPMAFLDFETFQSAVPLFDGTRPYQQIPFQYSLHILPSKGGNLKHSYYLAAPGIDPRRELLEKLLLDIPENSCIVVYNEKFEREILEELAKSFPEHGENIGEIISNLRDLMIPFKKKDYYHWQMLGSHSLKKVVSALVPELKYEDLEIKNGEMAMGAYRKMCRTDNPEELARIRNSLLKYCFLDTYAMAKIIEALESLLQK